MGNLKLKFRLDNLEFEVEGSEASVRMEFERFKSEFIETSSGSITKPANSKTTRTKPVTASQKPALELIAPEGMPAVEEIAQLQSPVKESDWLTIYSLYASNDAAEAFSEKDLRNYYRATDRTGSNRMNNVRNNLKTLLNNKLIVRSGETDYRLTAGGAKYAKQLLSGKNPGKSGRIKRGPKPMPQGEISEPEMAILNEEQQKELKKEFRTKMPKTQNEKIAVLLNWYGNHTGKEEIDQSDLRGLMTSVMKVPAVIGPVLNQMKKVQLWLGEASRGKVKLTPVAKEYLASSLPRKTKKAKAPSVKGKTAKSKRVSE